MYIHCRIYIYIYIYIYPFILGLSARWCSMFPYFLTIGEFLGYWGLVLVFWATARVGVHRLSLCLPYLGVFPFTLLLLRLNFIRVSSLRPTYMYPFGRPFTYSISGRQ